MNDDIKSRCKNIIWLGGSPCAGKTTISNLLAQKYHFDVYHCDEHYKDHISRCTVAQQPVMCRLSVMSEDEFWMRPIRTQVREEFLFYQEEFEMIIDDILMYPSDKRLLVEGTSLLPDEVSNVLEDTCNGIWLIPTNRFQRAHFPHRGKWVEDILLQCRNPEQASENWMRRDAIFALEIEKKARKKNLNYFWVDEDQSLLHCFELVETYLKLGG